MELTERELQIVADTEQRIGRRSERHSVAAAILLDSGEVFAGVDLFHFSGGPCAEIVALGRAMTDSTGRPVTVVAVRKGGKGIVSPCGRCRQVLHDYCPDIQVILAGDDGPVKVELADLLPVP